MGKVSLNSGRLTVVLMLMNAIFRLIFGIRLERNMFETELLLTGIIILFASIGILLADFTRIAPEISALLLGFVIAFDVLAGFPIQSNVWLWITAISMIIIGLSLWSEDRKPFEISKTDLAVGIFALTSLFSMIANIQPVKASTIYDHEILTSHHGHFKATIYVYKHETSIEGQWFYGWYVLLHSDEPYAWFNRIINMKITVDSGQFDNWEPKFGLSGGSVSIGLTPSGPTVGLGVPVSDIRVAGEYTNSIDWYLDPLISDICDAEFASSHCTTIEQIHWSIYVRVFVSIFGGLAEDTLSWSNIPIPPPVYVPSIHYRTCRGATRDIYAK